MLDQCGAKVAGLLSKNRIIREEDKEIIIYGLDALLSTLINLVVVISLGLILGIFLETIVFLLSFAILRVYAGGYHAKTRMGCMTAFVLIYLSAMALQHYTPDKLVVPLALSLAILSFVAVFIWAPVEHENRPYQGNEYHKFRVRSRIVAGLQTLLVLIGTTVVPIHGNLAYCISLAMLGVTIILALAKKKR